jgi:hypothetical protein
MVMLVAVREASPTVVGVAQPFAGVDPPRMSIAKTASMDRVFFMGWVCKAKLNNQILQRGFNSANAALD